MAYRPFLLSPRTPQPVSHPDKDVTVAKSDHTTIPQQGPIQHTMHEHLHQPPFCRQYPGDEIAAMKALHSHQSFHNLCSAINGQRPVPAVRASRESSIHWLWWRGIATRTVLPIRMLEKE